MTGVGAIAGVVAAGGAGGSGSGNGFSVSVPASVNGSGSGLASSGSVTSAAAAATVTGGTAPFAYQWAWVSGDTSITINSPAASSSTFGATVSAVRSPKQGSFAVTVTDSLGIKATSNPVLVSLEWFDTR